MTSRPDVGRRGLRRALWIAGAGVALTVVVLAWPVKRADPAIPDPPAEITVTPPWHLLAPSAAEPVRMTSPPRPLNAAAVGRALEAGYPSALRDRGIGGTVTLWLEIGTDGRVADAEVAEASGFRAFDSVALAVVRMAEFEPALDDGEPVAVRLQYEIPFQATKPVSDIDNIALRMGQLVAVYFGNTGCAPCRTPETKQAVREVQIGRAHV